MQREHHHRLAEYRQILPYFTKRFLLLLLLFVLVVSLYFSVDIKHERQQTEVEESNRVALTVRAIETDIAGVVSELRYLADSTLLQRYFAAGSEESRLALQAEMMTFARHTGRYNQLRWIDRQGMERLRVDYQNGTVLGVSKRQLQDKSARYYFREAITLRPGAIYVSPMDLNVEHGEVEIPYRPMIRFATPTINGEGESNGLLVLNYEASRLLSHFARQASVKGGALQLLNHDGFWLFDPYGDHAFAFMFNTSESFAADYPQEWQEMLHRGKGQLHTRNGIFSFASLNMGARASGDVEANAGQGTKGYTTAPPRDMLMVVSHFTPTQDLQLEGVHVVLYGTALLIILLTSGVIVWYLARAVWEKDMLLDRLALHAKVMETATNGVLITDTAQRIVAVNQGFSELTGYSAAEVLGQQPSLLASGRHDAEFYTSMWDEIARTGRWEGEIWNRHKNGEVYPEWLCISNVKDHNGRVSNYIGLFSVLSQQKSTESRLRELANSDPLTGLINRNLLYDRAAQAISVARRSQSGIAFLFVDLDGFKPINDQLGHAAGDMVLRQVAARLQEVVRESDTVARFGGDEFVILLQGVIDHEAVTEVAQKVLDSLSSDITVGDGQCRVGASIGISLYPADGENIETLLNKADQTMYRAKAAGRHRYLFASHTQAC